jgi:hypothetical protein
MEQLVHQLYSHRHWVRCIGEQRNAVSDASCPDPNSFHALSPVLTFGDEQAEPLYFGMAP